MYRGRRDEKTGDVFESRIWPPWHDGTYLPLEQGSSPFIAIAEGEVRVRLRGPAAAIVLAGKCYAGLELSVEFRELCRSVLCLEYSGLWRSARSGE